MKVCNRCKEDFDESHFHKRNASADGLAIYCKGCSKLIGRRQPPSLGKTWDAAALTAAWPSQVEMKG